MVYPYDLFLPPHGRECVATADECVCCLIRDECLKNSLSPRSVCWFLDLTHRSVPHDRRCARDLGCKQLLRLHPNI